MRREDLPRADKDAVGGLLVTLTKNWLFAGSDKGGERIANILTIIETAKMHGHNPKDYLTDVLTRIQDHPKDRIHELIPWNWVPSAAKTASQT